MQIDLSRAFSRARRQAFALIDLLVVFVVISMLFFLFISLCNQFRKRSDSVICFSNQRQLTQAYLLYADDNQGRLLGTGPPHVPIDLIGGGYWVGREGGDFSLPKNEALEKIFAGIRASPLYIYNSDVRINHCPGDPRFQIEPITKGWAYDSYAKSDSIGGTGWSGQQPHRELQTIDRPDLSMLFIEGADSRGMNFGTWVVNVSPPGWVDTIGIFHEGTNFSFMDGHVESRRWTDERLIRASKNSAAGRDSFFWPGASAKNKDYVWVHTRYRTVGWKSLPGL